MMNDDDDDDDDDDLLFFSVAFQTCDQKWWFWILMVLDETIFWTNNDPNDGLEGFDQHLSFSISEFMLSLFCYICM